MGSCQDATASQLSVNTAPNVPVRMDNTFPAGGRTSWHSLASSQIRGGSSGALSGWLMGLGAWVRPCYLTQGQGML